MAGLPRAWRGRPRLGRRRPRVRRLPQRLRRHVHRPRQPHRRRGGQGAPRSRAPTSPPRPTARSPSPRSSPTASASRSGGSPTPAPSRRWTRSTSPAALTGRDMILKIEGSYHGHHDAVMVSVYPPLEALGDRDDPRSVPYGDGYPQALTELTRAVPFNDAEALESVLGKLDGQGGRPDHGAGDDEHQHHPAGRGLSRAGERADRAARRQADLRRGQDRRHDRPRRRDGEVRRPARHHHPGEGDLRRLSRRRDRDDRRRSPRRSATAACTSTAPSTATRW